MRNPLHDEKAIVGAAMLSPSSEHNLVDLSPSDFSDDFYGAVWKRMREMKELDISTLESEFFDRRSDLQQAASSIPTSANMGKIAKRIREAAHRRRLMRTLRTAYGSIESGESIATVSAVVSKQFDDVHQGDGWKSLMDYLVPAYTDIEQAQVSGKSCMFEPTGFVDFDKAFGGMQKDGLIVIAGRPAMGKSAFAAALARKVSEDKPVLMNSMEMSGSQLAMRYYASESGVSLSKLTGGGMVGDDYSKLVAAQEKLGAIGIFINEKRSRSVAEVCAEARRFQRVHGEVGMVVVDYLTLMKMPDGYTKNDQVAETTRMLTALAGEIHCPIILLCQLNRECEKRADKSPMMSDLRDSGAIEQDAHQIIFPFRPEVYDKDPALEGLAIINMAKNRNGATGKIQMSWIADQTAFKDMTRGGFQ